MIVRIEDNKEFETEGCGCCGACYKLPQDRAKIIEDLKENISVAKEACAILGIDFKELM